MCHYVCKRTFKQVYKILQVLALLTLRALTWDTTRFTYTMLNQTYGKFEREFHKVTQNLGRMLENTFIYQTR